MDKRVSLSIIVPMYNERYFFEESLKRILRIAGSPLLAKVQVVVVDDCSNDLEPGELDAVIAGMPALSGATPFEWIAIKHAENMGKGKAIQTAIDRIRGDITIIHDADLEYDPKDILTIVEVFVEEDADAVLGSRFMPARFKRALYFKHELGNKLLTFLVDLVTDLNLTDVETCYKCVRTDLLKSIPLVSADFRIEVELIIKLAKRGAKIFEVPISYRGRTYEEGKKIGWVDGVLTLFAIAKFALSDQIYKKDEYGSQILGRLSRARRFNRWMSDTIRPYVGEYVLEIGSGTGNLTRTLVPRRKYYATDVNPHYIQALNRSTEGKPFLEAGYVDVTNPSSFRFSERIDTVICLNVLEHIEDDAAALKNIYEVLTAGGRAIVLVPNSPALFGSLDVAVGHKRRYTRSDLEELGDSAGFAAKTIIGFNRIGSLAWLINGRILRRKTFGLGQIVALNLLTPLFRLLDPITPLPPNSLIAIFEKPTGSAGNSSKGNHRVH